MNWQDKLKEKLLEHLIVVILSIIGVLLLILWQAIPSEIWIRVSDATPKRVLWALLALSLILIVLETAFIINLRRRSGVKVTPRQVAMFGVLWDEYANPLCPICKIHMYPTRRRDENNQLRQVVKCPKCEKSYILKDDSVNRLELAEAKEMLVRKHPAIKHDI